MEKILSVLPVLFVPALLTDSGSVIPLKDPEKGIRDAGAYPTGFSSAGYRFKTQMIRLFPPEANYTSTESITMKRVGNDFKEWGVHKGRRRILSGLGRI